MIRNEERSQPAIKAAERAQSAAFISGAHALRDGVCSSCSHASEVAGVFPVKRPFFGSKTETRAAERAPKHKL